MANYIQSSQDILCSLNGAMCIAFPIYLLFIIIIIYYYNINNIILADQIQQFLKKIIHHDQIELRIYKGWELNDKFLKIQEGQRETFWKLGNI
jgi:hypothetical protein